MFRSILKWGAISLGVLIVIGALFGDSGKATREAPATETAEAAPAKEATRPKATPDTSEELDEALEDLDRAINGDGDDEDKAEEEWEAPTASTNTSQDSQGEKPAAQDKPAAEKKPEMTSGQKNALESAHGYIDMTGFSKAGLIQQLSSSAGDGYSKADATFAANHVGADWNKEAVESARNYLDMTGFSKAGLIQQLSSSAGDKYTPAQARYAASKVY